MLTNLPAVPAFDQNLPAFLRQGAFAQVNARAMANLSSGAPNRVSFRAGRFRTVTGDGIETLSPENGGTTLDVVVIDANEFISKIYYSAGYDPNAPEPVSPDCFSDNGNAPSARAQHPQSALCVNCPQNAWGSKVTPTGSQVKACSDSKKIAVLPVSNIQGPTFGLAIPPASLKAWRAAIDQLVQRGIPICAVVFRLGFDTEASYPKLTFMPVGWIDEAQSARVAALVGTPEIDTLLGRNDMPRQGALPAPADALLPAQPAPIPGFPQAPAPMVATVAPATSAGEAPRRRGRPPGKAAEAPQPPVPVAQEVVQPLQAIPVAAVPLQMPPGMPAHTATAYQAPTAATPAPGRMPEIPGFLRRDDAPGQPAMATPTAAPGNVDAMLDQIMGKRPQA